MAGCAAHIGNGTMQKCRKLFFFFRGKVLHQSAFYGQDGLMHGLMVFMTFGENVDPFAAPVFRVRLQFQKPFLLQPGEKTGYRGMTQVKSLFNILWTGRFGLMGKITHDPSLGGGKLHFLERCGHGLIRAPVQDPYQMAVEDSQNHHLQKCSMLLKY